MQKAIEYALIVKNKTRLETLLEKYNTKAQTQFYIESLGSDYSDYELEHEQFMQTLNYVQRQINSVLKSKIVEREFLPNLITSEKELIIVIGQDGLVANTAKYVNGLPIIAINPDPKRYDGVLLPFTQADFLAGVKSVISNTHQLKQIYLAEAVLNDGQRILAFNDLYIGASTHISSRYKLTYNKHTETHSSSGIIVSTKAGSTGWMSSIFNMYYSVKKFISSSKPKNLKKINENEVISSSSLQKGNASKSNSVNHDWSCNNNLNDNELIFVVREAFKSQRTQTSLSIGLVTEDNPLVIESLMPKSGVIFSDGIENDFIVFNSGSVVTIKPAKEIAHLVLNATKR